MKPRFSIKSLVVLLMPLTTYSQLTYTTSTIDNTSCSECDYNGPFLLINQVCVAPSIGNGSIYGVVGATADMTRQGEWIELYNPNPCEAIDASYFILGSANNSIPASFSIPSGTIIPPLGFAIVRGSNAPPPPASTIDILVNSTTNICFGTTQTVNFWLPDDGGSIALFDNNGNVLDAISWGYLTWSASNYNPCNPPNSTLSSSTVLSALVNISSSVYTSLYSPSASGLSGNSFYRIIDGGTWGNITGFSSQSMLPEGPLLSYGTCNTDCEEPVTDCNGTATVNITSGTTPFTYLWNDPDQQTTATATGLCAGDYCVTVVDANQLTQIICVTVNNDFFNVDITSENTTCAGPNGEIIITPTDPGTYTYTWIPNVSSANIGQNLEASNYSISISDGNCTIDTLITVQPSEGIISSLIITPVSCITNQGLLEVTTVGGAVPYTYEWSDNTTEQIVTTVTGNTYSVTVTDNNGCTSTNSYTAITPAMPTVIAVSNSPICEGNILQLVANNDSIVGSTYSWTGPQNFSTTVQNPIIENATTDISGMYTVKISVDGCTDEDSIFVTIHANPIADFSVDTARGCIPLTIVFTDNSIPSSVSTVWDFGDGVQTNSSALSISHTYTISGDYTVTMISTSNSCTDTVSVQQMIHASDYANAYFSVDSPSSMIDNPVFHFTNGSTNANIYVWDFVGTTCTTEDVTYTFPAIPGFYDVQLIANNADDCSDTAIMTVQIIEPLIFYIPNTFTPDNDEFNQTFQPIFTSGFDTDNYQLMIFNRWGERIFETTNLQEGWNGNYKNQEVQDGTYTWTIVYKEINSDKKYTCSGHMNVIR